jgi:polygalacturonase
MKISSFLKKIGKKYSLHSLSKMRMLMFVNGFLIVLFGILFSLRSITEDKVPSPEQTPSPYASQDITITTPWDATFIVKEPIFPDHICSITDFGAVADGKTMNTEAFQQAITSCAEAGGGKVIVPSGIYLTGPIHLQSNIELHIERDATILFSINLEDYLPVVFSRFEGIEYYNYSPPIYAIDATNVAITGTGTLNGQGNTKWWKIIDKSTTNINTLYAMGDDRVPVQKRVFGTEAMGLRPAFIECIRCHQILIENVKIVNGPMWTIHPIYSDHIIVRGVDIATAPGPSTDGIAIDSSTNVLIENATLSTGDDAIVLKSGRDKEGMRVGRPTENVVIRNCTIKDAHSAIAIGSEMSGDVRNVFVSDIAVDRSQYGFRIKATKGRGGTVENIWAENFTMQRISIEAIQITTAYGVPFRPDSITPPRFQNIHLKNFSADKTSQAVNIDGLPETPIDNVSIEDIRLGTRLGIEISDAENISLNTVQMTMKKNDDPFLSITDGRKISFTNTLCPGNVLTCFILNGEKSENIDVRGNNFEEKRVQTASDVRPDAILYE